jgi:hypothetical protein
MYNFVNVKSVGMTKRSQEPRTYLLETKPLNGPYRAFLNAESFDIIKSIQELDCSHKKSSVVRKHSETVGRILTGVNLYVGALSILIQQSPEISSLVIRGVKFVLDVSLPLSSELKVRFRQSDFKHEQIAIRFFSFFGKLTTMIDLFSEHMRYLEVLASPEFREYKTFQIVKHS